MYLVAILIGVSSTAVNAELQPQTDLPIWMPDEIPNLGQVYVSIETTFDFYASFSADCNGEFATPDVLNPPFPRGSMPPMKLGISALATA